MLSAIVIAPQGTPAKQVVRTLAALVPAAVHGLLRDLTLACPADDILAVIADEAGCSISADADPATALAMALAAAREEWVLLLLAGFAPEGGFLDEMSDFASTGTPRAGLLRAASDSWLTRQFPDLSPVAGILAPRHLLAGAFMSRSGLVLKIRPRWTLKVRARRVV